MQMLIDKQQNSKDKIIKPDFSTKTGREFLAFYLQTKFKQILQYDKKTERPIFKEINPNFISKFSRRLIENPQKKFLIGVTGESASGKTTICKQIKKTSSDLNFPLEFLSIDNYFNDISELIKKYGSFDALRDNGYDVDSPESFQLDLLKEDLTKLSNGQDIKAPEYLINGTGISVPNSIPISAEKFVLVEGMAAMYKDIRDLFDVKIYIDIDPKIQKKWFMERAAKRNQDPQNAEKHWEYVGAAAEKYIRPSKHDADIIVNGASSLDYFSQIIEFIHTATNCFIS